jgi:large subunit ribosomal protein L32
MPVPKKRLSASRQGHRRSRWKASEPTVAFCPNCGAPKHPHRICGACGYYKDKVVSVRFGQEAVAAGE